MDINQEVQEGMQAPEEQGVVTGDLPLLDFTLFQAKLVNQEETIQSLEVVEPDIYRLNGENCHTICTHTNLVWLARYGLIDPEIPGFEHVDTLSVNTESFKVSQITSRFSGASWFLDISKCRVTLAGVGGIGSYVAFLLSRLNIESLVLYDPDIVEEGNLSGQLHPRNYIGELKLDSIAATMENFSGFFRHNLFSRAFTAGETHHMNDIAICGFDNMQARKMFYTAWKSRPTSKLFIDGRLAAEEFQVFAIEMGDERAMREYENKWLFNDDEAEGEVCSYKQTSYMAAMIGSVITNIFVNYVANHGSQEVFMDRTVPFLTTYQGSQMKFDVVL